MNLKAEYRISKQKISQYKKYKHKHWEGKKNGIKKKNGAIKNPNYDYATML